MMHTLAWNIGGTKGCVRTSVNSGLSEDGVHVNAAGQFKFYKSFRGAVLYAAKQCRPKFDSDSQ
jgi:hypothetical protein